jgi:hypothetical protein
MTSVTTLLVKSQRPNGPTVSDSELYQRALAGKEKVLGPDYNRAQPVLERLNGLSIAERK